MRGRDAPLRRPSTCGARRSLDSAEDPSPDAESSEPSVATKLEDDEADDAAVDGALEAAPEDDDAALVRETSAEARVALEEVDADSVSSRLLTHV